MYQSGGVNRSTNRPAGRLASLNCPRPHTPPEGTDTSHHTTTARRRRGVRGPDAQGAALCPQHRAGLLVSFVSCCWDLCVDVYRDRWGCGCTFDGCLADQPQQFNRRTSKTCCTYIHIPSLREGAKVCLLQCSYEAPAIFTLLQVRFCFGLVDCLPD